MAKLLTEEEYNALLADRERLEWMAENDASIEQQDTNFWICVYHGSHKHSIGDTMREAIDKARGVAYM